MQSIFSSTVIRPPSIPGPPVLLTSGIESKLKDLWSNQSCVIEVVSEVSQTISKFVCVYTVFTSLLLCKIRLIILSVCIKFCHFNFSNFDSLVHVLRIDTVAIVLDVKMSI